MVFVADFDGGEAEREYLSRYIVALRADTVTADDAVAEFIRHVFLQFVAGAHKGENRVLPGKRR